MYAVAIFVCLLIIAGLVSVLVFKKDTNRDQYGFLNTAAIQGPPGPPGPQGPPASCPTTPETIVEEPYPWIRRWNRGVGWGRGRFRPWVGHYPYYPQSLVTETCLNDCCDYDKCISGHGCQWKGIDNRWQVGYHPDQCMAYKNCVNSSTKPDKERHMECIKKALRV